MSQGERQPAKVIVSYSHRDAEALRRLQVHLKPLVRDAGLALWDDTRLKAGDRWRDEIAGAFASAGVAVLLVSADFLASDFIRDVELPALVEAERAGSLTILAVVLGPCRYRETPELERLQSVNPPDRPLSAMTEAEREAVWVELANAIEYAVFRPREPDKPVPKFVPRPPRRRSRPWIALIATALAFAALAVILAVRESGRPDSVPQPGPIATTPAKEPAKAPPPKPTPALSGRVLDGETGNPVAGVTLSLDTTDEVPGLHTRIVTTDTEGRFRFEHDGPLPTPPPRVNLVARKERYKASDNDPTLGATGLTIKLHPSESPPE